MSKIAQKYAIHQAQAKRWRDIALAGLKNIFTGKPPDAQLQENDKLIEELYKKSDIKKLNWNG